MSGFVGIFNLDGRPVDPELLAMMSAQIAHRGEEGIHVAGPFGIVCRVLRITPESARETQPLVLPSGAVLGYDGRLDNRDELLANLKGIADVDRDVPDPVLVGAVYERDGERFPEPLKGDFAIAVFDAMRGVLLLARDAIGLRPLHYHRVKDTFLFASEIKPILAHPEVRAEPDDEMAFRWLSRDFDGADGRTFFAGIHSVVPSHVLRVDASGLRARRYWDFDPAKAIRFSSPEDYVEVFRERIETAVRRRLRSAKPVTILVSGGLDSSFIYCVAERIGRDEAWVPRIFGLSGTYERGSPADEERYLDVLERALGTTILRIPAGDTRKILDGALEVVAALEAPLLGEQWREQMALSRAARELGSGVVLTGQMGDQVLDDQSYLVDLVLRLRFRMVARHLRVRSNWTLDVPSNQNVSRLVLDLARWRLPVSWVPSLRRLRSSLVGTPVPALPRRLDSRRLVNTAGPRQGSARGRSLYRQARGALHVIRMEVANKSAAHHGMEMALPFADRDLIECLMAIPGEVNSWEGLPRGLARQAMQGFVPEEVRMRRWKADFTHLRDGAVQESWEDLDRVLRQGDVVRRGYARHGEAYAGTAAKPGASAMDILGLEVWLRRFFSPS